MATKAKKAGKATGNGSARRSTEATVLWGNRDAKRLADITSCEFCGKMTVRELATIAAVDGINFPQGLDTPLCVGDFEGNYCTNVLSVTMGGAKSDHLCLSCDPHGGMQ